MFFLKPLISVVTCKLVHIIPIMAYFQMCLKSISKIDKPNIVLYDFQYLITIKKYLKTLIKRKAKKKSTKTEKTKIPK